MAIRVVADSLSYHLRDDERARAISERLYNSYPTRDFPITADALL